MLLSYFLCLKFLFVKNIIFLGFCVYGIGVSSLSIYWGLAKDMPALEHAVMVKNHDAEMRHRINVFADGTWVLLGNLVTVAALIGINKCRCDE